MRLSEVLDDKRAQALKLQQDILDHPYGERLELKLKTEPAQEVYSGTSLRIAPDVIDQPRQHLTITDASNPDSYTLRIIWTPMGAVANYHTDSPNHFAAFNLNRDSDRVVSQLIKPFVVCSLQGGMSFFDADDVRELFEHRRCHQLTYGKAYSGA